MERSRFKLTTKSMTYLAIFAALQILLEYLTQFTPQMPLGGNVAFSLVVLFLGSYLMGPIYGVVMSMVCVGIHFVLGFATYYGIVSLFFDYLIPFALIGATGIIPIIKIHNVNVPIGIIIVMILKTICHLISGWYAFKTPLGANLVYNLPYNIATLVCCYILFNLIYYRLKDRIKL